MKRSCSACDSYNIHPERRSLNLEQEAQVKQLEKDKERASLTGIVTPSVPAETSDFYHPTLPSPVMLLNLNWDFTDVQTLDTMQALCLPLGASVSLLVMFFFFDSMQLLFAVCTASKFIHDFCQKRRMVNDGSNLRFTVIATVALAFLLLPMCQYLSRPCTSGNK